MVLVLVVVLVVFEWRTGEAEVKISPKPLLFVDDSNESSRNNMGGATHDNNREENRKLGC